MFTSLRGSVKGQGYADACGMLTELSGPSWPFLRRGQVEASCEKGGPEGTAPLSTTRSLDKRHDNSLRHDLLQPPLLGGRASHLEATEEPPG